MSREIVDRVSERGECDFVVDVAAELPLQVIAEMMGVPHEDRHQLFDWSNRMIGSEDPEYAVSDAEAMEAATEMFMYANELAAKKRANPSDDIISALLQAEVEGEQLTDLEFDLFFELLAVAGNETTRNLISHGMHFMFETPDAWQALLADRSLLPTAVDEMLRYASPVMYMRRTAQREIELRGETIKEGDPVALWYISGNRDEEVFDRPNEFDITRSPNDYVVLRRRRPALLPRRQPREARDPRDVRGAARPSPRHPARRRRPAPPLELHQRHQAHAGHVLACRLRRRRRRPTAAATSTPAAATVSTKSGVGSWLPPDGSRRTTTSCRTCTATFGVAVRKGLSAARAE